MSSINPPIALLYKNEVKYLLMNALKVLTIQIIFNISTSNIYLQDRSGTIYFPNFQGEFTNINKDILLIQPSTEQLKLETIYINNTETRYFYTTGDFIYLDFLITGYHLVNKNMRRSLIKFDNLNSINGKKIVKVYLKLFGKPGHEGCTADLREVFVHRVNKNYGNILKYSEMPSFYPIPEASIMVGETYEEVFYWDITSLVISWNNKVYPNYGLLLKQNDPFGKESSKTFYRTAKPPELEVVYLTS